MLSSSESVFEKQESTVSASKSPRSALGWIREAPLSACPHARRTRGLSYCLTTKSMAPITAAAF